MVRGGFCPLCCVLLKRVCVDGFAQAAQNAFVSCRLSVVLALSVSDCVARLCAVACVHVCSCFADVRSR